MTNEEDSLDRKEVLERIKEDHQCLEKEVLDTDTVKYRNWMGVLSVLVICGTTVLNAYTTHFSVTNGHGWPSDLAIIFMNIGVVFIGWAFMRTNTIINSFLQVESAGTVFRRKAADLIRPSTDPPRGPGRRDDHR